MPEPNRNPKVGAFLNKADKWRAEYEALREIVLDCGLTEDLKWGHPCYTLDGRNVVLIYGFKEYCALLFVKGALMKDPDGLLIQQTENVQAGRQIRFADRRQIVETTAVLKAYIREAAELEKSGAKVQFKSAEEFAVPEEFKHKIDEHPELKAAFEALTPGRRRAYLLHFSAAKQSKTRMARIENAVPRILDGKGLDDR